MGGARNSFCVVLLADHGGLATQGPRHRRLASLECINHIHLQRRRERTREGEKRKKRKGKGSKTKTKGQKEWLEQIHLLFEREENIPSTPQIKRSVSTKSVWQEKGWHSKIKKKVVCKELLFFRRKERLEGVREKETEHKGNYFYKVMSLNRTCANYSFFCVPLTMHDRHNIEIHEDFESGMVGMEGVR